MRNIIFRSFTTTQRIFSFLALVGLLLVILAGRGWAGGLYLNEFGTPSMGVAGAGAEAVAADASTSFHNPAGMTRLEGKELMLAGGLVVARVEFDPAPNTPIPGGDGGNAGGPGPVLGAFYVHSLSDRLKFGVDLVSLSAAMLDYDNDWTGRFQVQDVSIVTLTLNPTIAYRVNDWLSLAGGVGLMYASLDMTVAVPNPFGPAQAEIDGDDTAVGFNLGAMVELSEQTRLGLIYWSETEPDFSGDVKLTPPGLQVGIETSLPLVQFVKAGIYHEINDRFALLGTIGWEDWSELDDQNISTARASAVIPRGWDDTWKFAGGLHYRPVEDWLLQFGAAYDTSPVDTVDRTADMPIDRQIRLALGAQYQWSERATVGGSFVYADLGDAEIRSSQLIGDYDRNEAFFFAVNVNWKF